MYLIIEADDKRHRSGFIIKADTKEELEAIEETLVTIGKRNSCQIEAYYLKQRKALNTGLPIGVRQVETMRTLMTQSLAVLMSFNVQELYLPGKSGKSCL